MKEEKNMSMNTRLDIETVITKQSADALEKQIKEFLKARNENPKLTEVNDKLNEVLGHHLPIKVLMYLSTNYDDNVFPAHAVIYKSNYEDASPTDFRVLEIHTIIRNETNEISDIMKVLEKAIYKNWNGRKKQFIGTLLYEEDDNPKLYFYDNKTGKISVKLIS